MKPLMEDLPLQRLPLSENSYPFYSTGIDFFGPFATRNNDEYSKRYVLFFTCLVTRAVNSEIFQQIDTNSTLQAIRRFIARRGKPRIIFSDNGKGFVAADKELQESLSEIQHSNDVNDQCQLLKLYEFNFYKPIIQARFMLYLLEIRPGKLIISNRFSIDYFENS